MFQRYGLLSSLTASFDSDYKAVLDYATANGITHPSAACKTIQNKLVLDLKAANAWSRYDVWYTFASDSTDPEFGTINWINPSLYKSTRVNNPNYTAKKGYNARSTNPALGGYVNTNFNPSAHTVNCTRTNGAFIHYVDDNTNANSMVDYGVGGVTSQRIMIQTGQADNTKQFAFSSSISTTNETVDAISKGVWINQRTSLTTTGHKLFRDGVAFDSVGVTSGQPFPNYPIIICGLNTTNTTFNNFSLKNVGLFAVGDSHAGIESTLATIWYTYFNALQAL